MITISIFVFQVFGGRVESFKPRLTLTEDQISQGYTIEYVDFCSLYPYVQWIFSYTINAHPTVIVDRTKLNRLVQNQAELVRFLNTNFGLCYCKVLPPPHLNFAVLPYRTRDKTVFPLCRTCAEQDKNDYCIHNDDERTVEGTYTFYELAKSIERGYRVRHIFEVSKKNVNEQFIKNCCSYGTMGQKKARFLLITSLG